MKPLTRKQQDGKKFSPVRPAGWLSAMLVATLWMVPVHWATAQEPFPPGGLPSVAEPEELTGMAAIPDNFVSMLEALEWFAIPFVLATVIAVWFIIERLVVLRTGRVIPRPFVGRFLQHLEQGHLDQQTALKLCQESGSPVSEIFAHGIRKWGKSSVEVEQAIIDGGEREVSHLRKHLNILNGVATIAPLLGLLGTVVGMIQSFNDIAGSDAMGRPEELARGIALALLTTAVGLTIAIPSLIAYMYLAGRVDTLVMEMDRLAQTVVQFVSAEALASRPAAKSHAATARVAAPPSEARKAV